MFATDDTGTKVWEARYLPFGGVQASTGTTSELRFPGQWFQSESGLHQNWMREYDPTLGRYIQADPLGLVDGASVYGYALQNPGRYVDPRGEFAVRVPSLDFGLGDIVGDGCSGTSSLPIIEGPGTLNVQRSDGLTLVGGPKSIVSSRVPSGSGGMPTLPTMRSINNGDQGIAQGSGILRDAAKGKGNFGLGSATRAESNALGKAWVGKGATKSSNGKSLVSKDGSRMYRSPTYKPKLGKTQANFERRFPGQTQRRPQANGHLDITD